MKNTENILIPRQIKTFFKSKSEEICEQAQELQKALSSQLIMSYPGIALSQKYHSWLNLNLNKKRYQHTISLAKDLNERCQQIVMTVFEAKEFLSYFKKFVTNNSSNTVDQKLIKFVNKFNQDYKKIEEKIIDYVESKKLFAKYFADIFYHHIAIENETKADADYRLSSDDIKIIRESNNYHEKKIYSISNSIIGRYQDLNVDGKAEFEQLKKTLMDKLIAIEDSERSLNKFTMVKAGELDRHISNQKIKFLQKNLRYWQLQKIEIDILQTMDFETFLDTDITKRAHYFLQRTVARQFSEQLKFEEKLLFWRYILKSRELTHDSADVDISLCKNKREWYVSAYNPSGVSQLSESGVFEISWLSDELMLTLCSVHTSGGSLKKAIDKVKEEYIKNKLKFDGDPKYITLVTEWKKTIDNIFEKLKRDLIAAQDISSHPAKNPILTKIDKVFAPKFKSTGDNAKLLASVTSTENDETYLDVADDHEKLLRNLPRAKVKSSKAISGSMILSISAGIVVGVGIGLIIGVSLGAAAPFMIALAAVGFLCGASLGATVKCCVQSLKMHPASPASASSPAYVYKELSRGKSQYHLKTFQDVQEKDEVEMQDLSPKSREGKSSMTLKHSVLHPASKNLNILPGSESSKLDASIGFTAYK